MWRCWVLLVVVGCTKPNPEVCCLDPDDCASIGVSDPERTCSEGLACVNNACVVPSCSTDGCTAAAPVCDITLDVCTACTGPADCDQFETKVCDTTSGACVECVSNDDCPVAKQICAANACRGCILDTECESGACDSEGLCVDEANVVYMATGGTDGGECTREAPCKTPQIGVSKTVDGRNHVVFSPGTYTTEVIRVNAANTSASFVFIHGGGATIQGANQEVLFTVDLPTTVRDLTVVYPGVAFSTQATTTIERCLLQTGTALNMQSGAVTVRDVTIETRPAFEGLSLNGGSLTLERAIIKGGVHGVVAGASSTATLTATNVVVSGTSDTAFELTTAESGSLNFVSVTAAGAGATAVSAVKCGGLSVAVRSSILWTPTSSRTPIQGCMVSSTIAGPVSAVGAENIDPMFVDEDSGDVHLTANSPAIDRVDDGPALDLDGEARPRGARFDIGADER